MKIGKGLYHFTALIFSFFLKFSTSLKNIAWPRNSLLQNYFVFGKSDLDLTILINEDNNVGTHILRIRKLAKPFIIIKEMNFYYPFAISITPSPINFFEWSRDPNLKKFISKNSNLENDSSEKIVYFLNIFSSMKDPLKEPLAHRSLLKWNFHLKMIMPDEQAATKGMTSLEILEKACLYFFKEKGIVISQKLSVFFQSRRDNIPLHIFMESVDDKDFYLTFFSHIYSYMHTVPTINDSIYADIFIKQIAWETWAMLTQPWLFKENKDAYNHLENLYITLFEYEKKNKGLNEEISLLKNHIKQYQSFLTSLEFC